MMCEQCGQNVAEVRTAKDVGGNLVEYFICFKCFNGGELDERNKTE